MTDQPADVVLAYDLVAAETAPSGPGQGATLLGGWAGPEGPAIDPETWPRSPRTGQPLRHCLTIRLPEPYRRFPDTVAVSVFQWNDGAGFGPPLPHMVPGSGLQAPAGETDPFFSALAAARPHPRSSVSVQQGTGEIYALVHLTQAEVVGARQSRPAAAPLFLYEGDSDEIPRSAQVGTVWLVPRDDPNAGVAPDGPGYQDVPDRFEWFDTEHLGGTLMDPDDSGAGKLSPFYLEINRIGGFSFGGDNYLAFDLGIADPLGYDSDPT